MVVWVLHFLLPWLRLLGTLSQIAGFKIWLVHYNDIVSVRAEVQSPHYKRLHTRLVTLPRWVKLVTFLNLQPCELVNEFIKFVLRNMYLAKVKLQHSA